MMNDTWRVGTIHLWRQLISTSFVNIGDWKRVDGFDIQDWIAHNYPSIYKIVNPEFNAFMVDWDYINQQIAEFAYPREIPYRTPSTVKWLNNLGDAVFDWQKVFPNTDDRRFSKQGLRSIFELTYVHATEPFTEVLNEPRYWSDWLTLFQWEADKYIERKDDDRWNYGGQALSYSWAANYLGLSALLMKQGIRPTSHAMIFGNEVQDATASGN